MEAYKHHFSDSKYLVSFFSGFGLLAASLFIQNFAIIYTAKIASDPVTDIVLSNTRVYDVDGIFIYGAIFLIFFVLGVCLMRPWYFPFVAKSVAVFVLIRSAFMSLTHISPFPNHVVLSNTVWAHNPIFSGIFNYSDLFFSGHTGIPFLLALMFWHEKKLRYTFLGFSLMFAVVVLLGHLHYSIDVLSAFFITYTIFQICKFLFKKDWELFSKTSHATL